MTIKEFCIGNYINPKFPMYITAIFEDEVYADFVGNEGDVFEFKLEDIVPIPISREYLEEFGFTYKKEYLAWELYISEHVKLTLVNPNTNNESLFLVDYNWENNFDVVYLHRSTDDKKLYVHTLQNILTNLNYEYKNV